ncbi:GPP34 family phosphoprotein [Filobacillus milosensis]|uniref:GPP34 family phosphoprotein n=1 Tax=Filobacillus milosensis TaxID=94137 RepID=A0A4Y8IE24_9BACI|nr:GPP34 family phosphoprotein [Filobacillus milosensis]TFB14242.1 GPP34 family phosphoprotein [Filobacillus milosensis]
MLTLTEELLLIALDDETGKMSMSTSSSIHFGLAGAILMELALNGCIDYKNKKVIFLDQDDSGDELLNESLQYMKEKDKGKPRSMKHWVTKLGGHIQWKKKHQGYIDRLIERGILKQEEQKVLFVFSKEVYPSENTGKENAIRAKVKEAIRSDEKIEGERTVVLIGLLHACELAKTLFTKEEYKDVKKKIKHIMKNNPHGKAVSVAIDAMNTAIIASVGAAAAASSSSS